MFEVQSPTALMCPRRNLALYESNAVVSYKGKRTPLEIPQYELSSSVLARVFADETLSCWKKFSSGQTALFPEVDLGWQDVIKGKNRVGCHVCSEIYFPKYKGVIPVAYEEELNKKIPGKKKTYLSELNNDDAFCQKDFDYAPGCWSNMATNWKKLPKFESVDTSKTYAVVIMRRGFEWCLDEPDHKGELSIFTYVLPHDKISEVCDMVVT